MNKLINNNRNNKSNKQNNIKNNKKSNKMNNRSNRKKNINNNRRSNKKSNKRSNKVSNRRSNKNNKNNNRRSNNKNKYISKGGALVNIHPKSNENPFLHKNGQGVMRLNNYLCLKEDKLNDFSNIIYELFFRRIQEKTMIDDVDRRVDLDLNKLKIETDAEKEKELINFVNNNRKINPIYK